MKAGFLQYEPQFGEVDMNLRRVLNCLKDTDADLIVLPELAFTGYYFKDKEEVLSVAEDPNESDTVEQLIALCRERDLYLVTGFAERRGDQCYNSALLLGPEGYLHTYRKIHLFNTEKNCFDPGDIPLAVRKIRGARVGMMICFDWIFPEAARTLALQGADIICHPANLVIPEHCQRAMITRCVENRVFSITANRYGEEDRPHGKVEFTGLSQVVAPNGTLLHRAGPSETELFTVDIDVEHARNKNITPQNNIFEDRRPDYYSL